MDKKPHYLGHRARLRERFLKTGAESLADYEMLEMLLFLAHPRRDVKPIAKALLAQFGSFAKVIRAKPGDLLDIPGIGATAIAALKTVQAAALKLVREEVMNQSVIGNWQQLLDHLHASMAYEEKEHFRLLFLDRKNMLIADEVQQSGTIDHAPIYPREVVKRALELGASAIIMVHNHPSGDPTPSKADIAVTKDVQAACQKLGIELHDHIIVAKSGHQSFKSMGLL
ncbi:DNA repair protein RadC [Rhodospirillaceae bacterium AH-315-P19]|nr:DNA repair protein RadC [Rhodospirillaceae bacterium AH-315-P19]